MQRKQFNHYKRKKGIEIMAERRMFSKVVIDSDTFLDMPLSAQALYFHLSMRADDDGFVSSPKRIQTYVGASTDDLKILLAKHFLIPFESGVVVIKHWKVHNYIQKDRYKETYYQAEKALLEETPKTKEYTRKLNVDTSCIQTVSNLDTSCIQTGYKLDTQVRDRDRDSIEIEIGEDKESAKADSDEPDGSTPPPLFNSDVKKQKKKQTKHKYGEYNNVLLTDEELVKLKEKVPNWQDFIERLSGYIASTGKRYKSHYVTMLNWYRRDGQRQQSRQTQQIQQETRVMCEYNNGITNDLDDLF